MSEYYVDPAATGANSGADWTNAYTDMQSALDVVAAGDTIHCRGTQTPSTVLQWKTNGTSASYIHIIGYNGSGVEDGTQFVIDATSVSSGFDCDGKDYYECRNIECKNASGDGWGSVSTANSEACVLVNCDANNNGGYGIYGQKVVRYGYCANITMRNNSSNGIYNGYGNFTKVNVINNGSIGFVTLNSCGLSDVIAHNNTTANIRSTGVTLINNAIIDGSTNGIEVGSSTTIISNSRITNNTTGISITAGAYAKIINDFFYNNTTDHTAAGSYVDSYTRLKGVNTSDGYADRASDDFDLSSTGEGVGVSTPVGDYNSSNTGNFTQGIPPAYTGGGGGGGLLTHPGMNGGLNG